MFLFKYNFPSPKLLLMSRFLVLRQQAVGLMRVWCKQWAAVFLLKEGWRTRGIKTRFEFQLSACSVVWHQANCSLCLWLIWFVLLSYIRGAAPSVRTSWCMKRSRGVEPLILRTWQKQVHLTDCGNRIQREWRVDLEEWPMLNFSKGVMKPGEGESRVNNGQCWAPGVWTAGSQRGERWLPG